MFFRMRYPEGRSDHAPFVQQLGVATMWPKFINKVIYMCDGLAAILQAELLLFSSLFRDKSPP